MNFPDDWTTRQQDMAVQAAQATCFTKDDLLHAINAMSQVPTFLRVMALLEDFHPDKKLLGHRPHYFADRWMQSKEYREGLWMGVLSIYYG